MSKSGVTEWYGEDLVRLVEDATQEALAAVALQIEGLTKRNIIGNNQVDTGFMVNSVYAITEDGSVDTYSGAKSSAGGRRSRSGRLMHEKAQVDGDGGPYSAVAVGARYAVYQEKKKPFLEPAMDDGISQLEAQMKSAHKAKGLD